MNTPDDRNPKAEDPRQIKVGETRTGKARGIRTKKTSGVHFHLVGALIGFLLVFAIAGLISLLRPEAFQIKLASAQAKAETTEAPASPVANTGEMPQKLPITHKPTAPPDTTEKKLELQPLRFPKENSSKRSAESPLGSQDNTQNNSYGDRKPESSTPVTNPEQVERLSNESAQPVEERPLNSTKEKEAPPSDVESSSTPRGSIASVEEEKKEAAGTSPMPNRPDEDASYSFELPFVFEFSLTGRLPQNRQRLLEKNGGTKESELAVAQALEWIAKHQLPDGGWSFDQSAGPGARSANNRGKMVDARNAATGLALLAFLGAGHTTLDGSHKETVLKGFSFLSKRAVSNPKLGTSFSEPGTGTMYSHGICTLAFCEAYAMTRDRELGVVARECIKLIENFQNPQKGGWRYQWQEPGDCSVTAWQIMAIESAQSAGIKINPATLNLAKGFLTSISDGTDGFYGYQQAPKGSKDKKILATTAMGLLCQMSLGQIRDRQGLQKGIEWLLENGPTIGRENNAEGVNMYYNYYASLVVKQVGGTAWDNWNAKLRDYLVTSIETEGVENGSWYFESSEDQGAAPGGRLYHTALSCLTLEVYYRYEGKLEAAVTEAPTNPEVILSNQPAPSPEETAKIREELKQLFPELYRVLGKKSGIKLEELETVRFSADRLSRLAAEESEPAKKFILFEQAYFAAIYHERPDRSQEILEAWKAQFNIDELAYQKQAFERWASLINQVNESVEARREVRRELLKMIDSLIQEAVKAERLELGKELHELSLNLAGQLGDEQLKKRTAKKLEDFLKQVDAKAAYNQALDTLKTSPENVAANSIAAKYETEFLQNWTLGLEHLRRVEQSNLESVLELESKETKEPLDLGESWWKAANVPNQLLKPKTMASRAEYWYRLGLQNTTGLEKERVLLRISEIEAFIAKEE